MNLLLQELREDNTMLSDAKNKVEEQFETNSKRMETIMDELVQSQIQLEEISTVC